MQKEIDYEQKFYDQVYKNKKLIKENNNLKEKLDVYEMFLNKNPLKKNIVESIICYIERKK